MGENRTASCYGCYDCNEEWYLFGMLLDCSSGEIRRNAICIPQERVSRENWQCPYLERYLNEEGTEKVCETFDRPVQDAEFSRVAFFLCKVSAFILHTPGGDVPLHCEGEAPVRLKKMVEFER